MKTKEQIQAEFDKCWTLYQGNTNLGMIGGAMAAAGAQALSWVLSDDPVVKPVSEITPNADI